MSGLCTINGWYWYCDVHDTHGNGDSESEVAAVSEAHKDHKLVEDDSEPCEITIISLTVTKSGQAS